MKVSFKLTKRKILSLILIVLLVYLSGWYFYRTFNLTIKEGVTIELYPEIIQKKLVYGESANITINSEINNYWLCEATCTHTFRDLSASGSIKELFLKKFIVKNRKEVSYDAEVYADVKGYGQKIYQYDIQCSNIRTNTCPSGQDMYRRKATIIVDYSPNEPQVQAIEGILNIFPEIAEKLAYAEIAIINSSNIVNNLDIDFTDRDSPKIFMEQYMQSLQHLTNIKGYWEEDRYEEAYSVLQEKYVDMEELYLQSKEYLENISNIVYTHNTVVERQKDIIMNYSKIVGYEKYFPYTGISFQEFSQEISTLLSLIDINTAMINEGKDYFSALSEQEYTMGFFQRLEQEFTNASENTRDRFLDLYLAEQLTCNNCSEGTYMNNNLSGIDSSIYMCAVAEDVLKTFEQVRTENNIRRNNISILSNISLDEVDVQERFEMLKIIYESRKVHEYNKAEIYIDYILKLYPGEIPEEVLLYIEYMDRQQNESNNYTNTTTGIDIETGTDNDSFNDTQSISEIPIDPELRQYYSLSFKPMIDNITVLKESCNRPVITKMLIGVERTVQTLPIIEINPTILAISDIIDKCCIGKDCDCCDGCTNYPTILLHGHSFVLENSAYRSTEIFNILEDVMIDDGYVSFGNFFTADEIYIRSDKRIIFKPTYYIDTKQRDISIEGIGLKIFEDKSGGITDYSRRLHTQIEYIRNITGQEKVNIITHSMGGLVVRKYLYDYGKDSINVLVMIGTPNQGIDERIVSLCKIFGQEKECDDMAFGSTLLQELSLLKDYPETHLIIGQGCDTNGMDGDGVIRKENVLIPGISIQKEHYINGTCTLTNPLHNSMLDVSRHPEIYTIIRSII